MPRGPGQKPPSLPPTGRFPSSSNGFELQKGNLTHHQRLVIVRKKDEEPRWTQEDLARWAKKQFGLLRQPTQSTISNILRSREKLETMTTSLDAKSARPVKHPELDAALLLWLRDRQSQQRATSGDELRDQAKQLADACQYADEMTYSNGWMRGFLTRHGIAFRRNQVDPRELHTLHDIQVAAASYAHQDVFTFVSTTLWYRAEPTKERVGVSDHVGPVGDATEPALCVGLAVNMDGSEKWSPVMVSRAKQPPSFQQKTAFQWGFHEYYFNGHAQMTSTIFEVWVKRLNQRMAQSNRRVLLVVDSAPSHLNASLSHVQVMIHADVPQLHLTPLRTEIAHAFKAFYRKKQLASAVDRAEAGARDRFAVSQLKAMRWVQQAWAEVPSEFIISAWASVALAPLPIAIAEAQYPQSTPPKNEIHAALTELLEEVGVPGRIKSHDVVAPRGEDDAPHYVYNDTTIMPLVIGALHPRADAVDEADMVDVAELTLPPDAPSAATQQHRALLLKLEQLRGVIQSLDEEAPPGEELTSVLAFLRRRQATLRAELQRLAREAEQPPTNGGVAGSQVAAAPVPVPVPVPVPTTTATTVAAAMAAASVTL